MNQDTTEIIVHALISSHLDYANSILYGINNYLFDKLQRVQNNAARVVMNLRKYDHVTDSLIQLHWLPVKARVNFKIILQVYKALNCMAPQYICNMVERVKVNRYNLRNNCNMNLVVPRSFNNYNDRAFAVCGPKLWNSLPNELKSTTEYQLFKSKLKTYLFKQFYQLY